MQTESNQQNNPEDFFQQSMADSSSGQTASAAAAALNAVKLAPDHLPYRIHAGKMLINDLQPQKAQQQIMTALQLEPNQNQLIKLKNMQQRVNHMTARAKRRPLRWMVRRFNQRIVNVNAEK